MTARLSNAVAGDLADWTGVGLTWKAVTNGNFQYRGNGTNTDWILSFMGPNFTGTGSGTFNHGCKQFNVAAAPDTFFFNSYTGVPFGSQTMGFNTITTTQVAVVVGGGLAWKAKGVSA